MAAYIAKAFGGRLAEVRAAMQALAGQFEPEALNRIGFRLYEQLRPEVPAYVRGWGCQKQVEVAAGSPRDDNGNIILAGDDAAPHRGHLGRHSHLEDPA